MTSAASMLSYDEALADIKARVLAAKTSFHAGMALLPKSRRNAMFALYGFCRIVDDIADDSPTPEEAARGLDIWRQKIRALFQGQPSDSITLVLAQAIKDYRLKEDDFQAIIDGMAMDSGKPIMAPDRAQLDLYCDRVASAVGRASVRIFGDDSPKAMLVAHHLGRAFQLTNILRDLGEDATRERLYLPLELLEKHGVIVRSASETLNDANLPVVCRDLASDAARHYEEACKAMDECIPSAMRPARVMMSYYGAIFDRLLIADWQNPRARVAIPKWQKIWLMLTAFLGARRG